MVVAESATLTIRVPRAQLERLDALANATKRSKSFLAGEALTTFLDLQEWQIAAVRDALDGVDAGQPFIDNERVTGWLRSWGTDHELPPPE
jgi:predicted transcriptional regulator